ncbi:MAG: hypothetical protein IJX28_04370 [Clostridia bacterium]|nr:hypothetical protein [Clostridia bacterium]
MRFQFLLTGGLNLTDMSGTGFLLLVAALALLLGTEIACISIMINKVLRARREEREVDSEESSRHYHYGAAALLMGVLPASAYVALAVLAGVTAVVSVVFVVLLIVFWAKGYLFVSSKDLAELHEPKPVAAPAALPADPHADAEEAPLPEDYTEDTAEEAPLSVFDEEDKPAVFKMSEESSVFGWGEDDDSFVSEEDAEPMTASADEPAESEEAEGVMLGAAPATVEDPTFADGTRPYKIVEKIVTETHKEVVREVPTPAGEPKSDSAAEQLMEKLTDFLDYELQKRKEADQAETAADRPENDSIPTLAKKPVEDEDAEDEDDPDDLETDEDLEEGKADEDDVDDEADDNDDRFTGNERIIGFDEATGCYIVAHYRKSFEAKLIQARPNIKQYYSELKNALLSYKGTKSRISWTADSFHNGRTQIAKINVKTRILELYLALEPESLEGTVYRGKNVGSKKKYADTPFQYKIRTPRKFKWAMELVQRTCEEQGLSPIDIEKIDYVPLYPFETTESLVARKLIKEYIREEKPATSFELDPDHVPEVPSEDESVIPANANFSWEFDNEVMEEKELPTEEPPVEEPTVEEPVEETIPEAPAEESVTDPQPASGVVRETVKITEMRYTERYYADAEPSYEQIITTHESLGTEPQVEEATVEEPENTSAEDLRWPEEEVEPLTEDAAYEAVSEEAEEEILPEDADAEYFFASEPEAIAVDAEISPEPEVYEETYEESYEEAYEESVEEPVADAEEVYAPEAVYTETAEEELYYEEESAEAEEVYATEEETYATEEYAEDTYEEASYEEEAYEEEESYEEREEEQTPPSAARPAPKVEVNPAVAVIDICAIEDAFPDGATINLAVLKSHGFVLPSATTLKIYATGSLQKRFSVEAHHFTLDAIYAISAMEGDTSMLY